VEEWEEGEDWGGWLFGVCVNVLDLLCARPLLRQEKSRNVNLASERNAQHLSACDRTS
jgi:hypothetical protein